VTVAVNIRNGNALAAEFFIRMRAGRKSYVGERIVCFRPVNFEIAKSNARNGFVLVVFTEKEIA